MACLHLYSTLWNTCRCYAVIVGVSHIKCEAKVCFLFFFFFFMLIPLVLRTGTSKHGLW